jgi:hypothetical protein
MQAEAFYGQIDRLLINLNGGRVLGECTGRQQWPQRGVYFLFEPGEVRTSFGVGPRVVRVGTHAVSTGSRTTLWNRLSAHRGPRNGNGNHRGSIFRHHVGNALIAQNPERYRLATWNDKVRPAAPDRQPETVLEKAVSVYLGRMRLVWIAVPDEPSASSDRAYIERNAIALLSGEARQLPSIDWLGRHSDHQVIRASGLWNLNHVGATPDDNFLLQFERYVTWTIEGSGMVIASSPDSS